jgi:FMN reductase
MAEAMTLMTVVGNPRAQSRTLQAALEVANQIAMAVEQSGRTVHRREVDLATMAPALFDWESTAVTDLVQQAMAADVLVVASPTYKASYTGLLKAFLDRFPSDALVGRVAVPVMVGAAPIHTLAPDVFLRPVLIEMGASCPTRGLFLLESQLPDLPPVVAAWLRGAAPALGLPAPPPAQ